VATAAAIGGFAVRPAEVNRANPATRAYFILRIGRGQSRQRAVVITNHGRTPLTVYVDPVDGLTGATSGVVYGNRGSPLHGAGIWVKPAARILTIPPHRSRLAHFSVLVPQGAAVGDHVAGLAVQAVQPTKAAGHTFTVTVIVRAVVGIEVIVPGHTQRSVKLLSVALAPLPGTTVPSVLVGLKDTGGLICHPRLTVALRRASQTRTVSQTLGTILPRQPILYPLRWPAPLLAGRYAIRVAAANCGQPQTLSALARYGPVHTTGRSAQPESTREAPTVVNMTRALEWWQVALIALGAALAGGLIAPIALRLLERRRT